MQPRCRVRLCALEVSGDYFFAPSVGSIPFSDADSLINRQFVDRDDGKVDPEATPRGLHEAWRFTPSLLDTNSFSFSSFANQPPGYYTPTPGGVNTLYHNQAGDLHTPNIGFHLGTPLSMPMSENSLHAGSSFDMPIFHPQLFNTQSFQHAHQFPPQQSYAPSSFVHQDSGYEAMEGSPENDMEMDSGMKREAHVVTVPSHGFESSMPAPPLPAAAKYITFSSMRFYYANFYIDSGTMSP